MLGLQFVEHAVNVTRIHALRRLLKEWVSGIKYS
jgi:hypothetical protein